MKIIIEISNELIETNYNNFLNELYNKNEKIKNIFILLFEKSNVLIENVKKLIKYIEYLRNPVVYVENLFLVSNVSYIKDFNINSINFLYSKNEDDFFIKYNKFKKEKNKNEFIIKEFLYFISKTNCDFDIFFEKSIKEINLFLKKTDNFVDLNRRRFDVFIFNKVNNKYYIIEIDGRQHYRTNKFFNQSLLDYQKSDQQKNDFCIENNIELLRIHYHYNYLSQELICSFLMIDCNKNNYL